MFRVSRLGFQISSCGIQFSCFARQISEFGIRISDSLVSGFGLRVPGYGRHGSRVAFRVSGVLFIMGFEYDFQVFGVVYGFLVLVSSFGGSGLRYRCRFLGFVFFWYEFRVFTGRTPIFPRQ